MGRATPHNDPSVILGCAVNREYVSPEYFPHVDALQKFRVLIGENAAFSKLTDVSPRMALSLAGPYV